MVLLFEPIAKAIENYPQPIRKGTSNVITIFQI